MYGPQPALPHGDSSVLPPSASRTGCTLRGATAGGRVMGGRPLPQVIAKARVPIIKFEEVASGFNFDISFDIANGPVRVNPCLSDLPRVSTQFLCDMSGRFFTEASAVVSQLQCWCTVEQQPRSMRHGCVCAVTEVVLMPELLQMHPHEVAEQHDADPCRRAMAGGATRRWRRST